MTVLWGNGVFEHSGGSRHGGGIGFGTAFAKKFFGSVGRAVVEDRIEKAMDV